MHLLCWNNKNQHYQRNISWHVSIQPGFLIIVTIFHQFVGRWVALTNGSIVTGFAGSLETRDIRRDFRRVILSQASRSLVFLPAGDSEPLPAFPQTLAAYAQFFGELSFIHYILMFQHEALEVVFQ